MANISYQPPHRPLRFRLINWTGTKLRLNRLPLLSLTEESLLEEAQRLSGLSDWGDEDFLIPLRIFLESLKTEAHLNVVGRYFFRQDCIRLLSNRLRLQDDFKRHNEIFQVPIRRPLFVVGLFRSGTTFLHNLLSQDISSRWLHLGEAFSPSPSPNPKTMRTVRQIYEHFGYPFNNAVEENINRWIGENPQHKHSIHNYSLEQFGFKRNQSKICQLLPAI